MSEITFRLPANDLELVEQVTDFIRDNEEYIELDLTLSKLARKYRFAGYTGALHYLMQEIRDLKQEIAQLRQPKKGWFF